MEIPIARSDDTTSSLELKDRLEKLPGWDKSVMLEVRHEEGPRFRGVDQTVLIAIVGVVGPALGALVAGLLRIAEASRTEKITLVTKDGERVEVEARHAKENAVKLLQMLEAQKVKRIIL
jgi:hypothetical protein